MIREKKLLFYLDVTHSGTVYGPSLQELEQWGAWIMQVAFIKDGLVPRGPKL